MKNLLIYINPEKKFFNKDWKDEPDILAKIQIDNSLSLGWKIEDILLITNFAYEYNGVKAIVIGDENYCEFSSGTPSKINAIVSLFNHGFFGDDTYWFHDFDAFQLENLELNLADDKIALTDYGITDINQGRDRRWSTGSIFFRKGSKDIFEWIQGSVYKYRANEEVSLLVMTRHNDHNLLSRIDKLNITYNFATRRRNIVEQYKITDLPIKVIHFHPFDKRPLFYLYEGNDNLAVCLYGKNPMKKVLVSDRLIEIFNKHGIL